MFDSNIEVQKFIENKMEEVINDIKGKNLEYEKERRYFIENLEKYKAIISKFSKEERDFINEYNNNFYDMRLIEREEFYYRGGQDCIKFLKLFGMI